MNHELALSPTTSSTSLNQIVLFAAATISPQQQLRWPGPVPSFHLPSHPHKGGHCLQFGDEDSVAQKGEAAYLRSPSDVMRIHTQAGLSPKITPILPSMSFPRGSCFAFKAKPIEAPYSHSPRAWE